MQIGRISLAIGNRRQMLARIAPDHGEEALRVFALRLRETLAPRLELVAGHILGIEIGAQRLALRNPRQKRRVTIQVGPRTLIQPEVMRARLAERRRVPGKLLIESAVALPKLI